jgi:chaperonin GroES
LISEFRQFGFNCVSGPERPEKIFQAKTLDGPQKMPMFAPAASTHHIDEEAKSAGGIIIPDTAKEKPMEGIIVSVGPGARNDKGDLVALDVKAGDRVLFGKWSGTEVNLDGRELLIMKESDIMAVIETKKKSPKAKAA